jgi:hypothetical protein
MEAIYYIILFFLITILIFVLIHLRPLKASETESLSKKRRKNSIRMYFKFSKYEFSANSQFKKSMNSSGQFYQIQEGLYDFPSIASALLKYKKHEWAIIAFEKNRSIDLIWINKGEDKSSVQIKLNTESMIHYSKTNDYSSILIFHNHPNSNPSYYDCTKPSEQDVILAKEYANELNQNGYNLLEFVCERGKHYEYFSSISDKFLPIMNYKTDIENLNNISKYQNLKLHCERIF